MSRCIVCNVVLSEAELKHKDPVSGKYTDTCSFCLLEEEHLAHDSSEDVVYVEYDDDPGIDCWSETTDDE